MAQADHARRFASLRLSTASDSDNSLGVENEAPYTIERPPIRSSAASQDTIRATPPMNIPTPNEEPLAVDGGPDETSYIDHYMRTRQPSVSFSNELRLDSGHRQSIEEPLEKPAKARPRGRSLLQAMSDDMARSSRAHSESDRNQYDPVTGRHLPRYSTTPPREEAHIGEGRFPLLQATVDEMARESHTKIPQVLSMTSESTMSPNEEVRTPRDDEDFILASPPPVSPFSGGAAFSYDEPKSFRRTASQRWRDGQNSQSAQDFFSRAGSLRQSRFQSSRRLSKPEISTSTRSPRSAASSYLRAFSMSSSGGGDNIETGPPGCDAEGQTIGEDFVLGKQIGYGGFSIIKEVTQLRDGEHRKLAVKIVRRTIENKSEAENDQAQAEFEHEVELWRFLNHPNILPLEAVYKLDEATFCFIPLNTGGTLFDLVRTNRKGVDPQVAKSYSYQLASALRYLHLDARVVHRDIKLENCLIDGATPSNPGLLRVCDFGMAEWLSNDNSSGPPSPNINATDRPPLKYIGPADTSTSAFAGGSLEYAAPEILRIAEAASSHPDDSSIPAERSIVSPAVDIWAYGVCVYSLLVGSRPFQNAFQPRVVMAILAGEWDSGKLIERGGPDALELVESCLDMDEGQRWRIGRVIQCEWLAELASGEDDDDAVTGPSGWRL